LFARIAGLAVLVIMRTTLAFLVTALGACTDAGPTTAPPAPPMPSARSVEMPDFDVGLATPACVTRWSYASLGVTFDCRTAFVNGDPLHYITTCPVPASVARVDLEHPADRDEVTLNTRRQLVHERATYTMPANGRPVEDLVAIYDDAGRFRERTVTDGAGNQYTDWTVTAFAPDGQMSAVLMNTIPLEINGTVFSITGQKVLSFGYDPSGRMITEQARYTADNWLTYDRTITYDDAALRRNYATTVDPGDAFDPLYHPGPALTRAYELLDRSGNVLEAGNDDPYTPYQLVLRYDEQGRVVSRVKVLPRSPGLTISYIYDCP
jgi:hypothetical protein